MEGKLVTIMLIVDQVLNVGGNTLSKAAMARGLSNFVFITYVHGLGFTLLIPSAFLFHRITPAPPITYHVILRLILLGFISYCCSIFLYVGIQCSSPTLASALTNLSPAFTFTFAIIFRMEIFKIRSQSSLFKIIGTIISIAGALVVIFYQGLPMIVLPSSNHESTLHFLLGSEPLSWVFGGLLLFISSIFLSLMFIIKTWIVRDFNSDVLVSLIFFFFETIIAGIIALVVEKDASVWTPSFHIEIIAILFGAVEVVVINTVQTWACRTKGPVFAVMFKPLQMIIAVIMGVILLRENLYIGSVLGGLIIAVGFYTVMKGKSDEGMLQKELEDETLHCCESSDRIPFLTART